MVLKSILIYGFITGLLTAIIYFAQSVNQLFLIMLPKKYISGVIDSQYMGL
jgi:hypothetical protein